MIFQKGDHVRFLSEAGSGVVQRIEGETAWVEVDGFDLPFPLNELLAVDGGNTRFVQKDVQLQNDAEMSAQFKAAKPNPKLKGALSDVFSRVNHKGIPEIDLHLHQLIAHERGMLPHEKIELQMEYLNAVIYQAEQLTVREFIVIHGVGEGVLKSEVRKKINSIPYAECWDASYKTYGYGATHVKLFGLTQ
jgi:hypothetical protein